MLYKLVYNTSSSSISKEKNFMTPLNLFVLGSMGTTEKRMTLVSLLRENLPLHRCCSWHFRLCIKGLVKIGVS